jgi:hypothetical protein
VELGKSDAVKQLKIDLGALRDQLRATEEDLAVNATAAREAERVLSDKQSELARLTSALDERSTLEDVHKTEIVALRMQVETLHGRLAQAGAAVEERAAVRALSENESELARLAGAGGFTERRDHGPDHASPDAERAAHPGRRGDQGGGGPPRCRRACLVEE